MALIALLGLLGGIPMGPEAGLGAFAGGMGMVLAGWLTRFKRPLSELRRRLYVMTAMASGFGR